MRFWVDSITPPSSAMTVSRPSPRTSVSGRRKRAVALPSRSVVSVRRAVSASSIVTIAVIAWLANGSPVARLISIAAATLSPAP